MKKTNNNHAVQSTINFPSNGNKEKQASSKVVNLNEYSKKSFDAFVIRNTRSY